MMTVQHKESVSQSTEEMNLTGALPCFQLALGPQQFAAQPGAVPPVVNLSMLLYNQSHFKIL